MSPTPTLWACLCVFFIAASWLRTSARRRAPGPRGYPILGNLLDVPVISPWNYFEQLCKQYGPIVRLTLIGNEVLVLSNPNDCEELLSKRSSIYSSRQPLVYAGKYQSNEKRILLLSYGEELRRQRAAFAEMLNPRAVKAYEKLYENESIKLLSDMLGSPASYKINLKRFTASLIYTLTYGSKRSKNNDDDGHLHAVLKILDDFLPECQPGAHLCDMFPVLDRLPDVFAPWRLEAKAKHGIEKKLYMTLIKEVKDDMDAGIADECLTKNLWEQHGKGKFDEETLAYIAGTAFEAAIGATSGTLLWFIVAMIVYPETMRRAQAEIDDLLGDEDVIPSAEHMDNLPYCVALTREVMRWMPVTPGSFFHYSDVDDEYKGYHISKNTLIIPLVWAIHRDDQNYERPLQFDPTRFLGDGGGIAEGHYGFGFGRRICPARYMASRAVFLVIVRILWAFDIRNALDEEGKPIEVDPYNATFDITSEPNDFPLSLTARSNNRAGKIREEYSAL